MSRLRAVVFVLPFLAIEPAFAAPAGSTAAAPAAEAATPAPAEPAPAAGPAAPSTSSALVITLNTTGDFERKSVNYGCQGVFESLAVDYLNAAPNYLAMMPLDGSVLVFNTVLAGSGAKYVAGKYVWWTKGSDASLYDLTVGPNAKPIATCSEVDDTP